MDKYPQLDTINGPFSLLSLGVLALAALPVILFGGIGVATYVLTIRDKIQERLFERHKTEISSTIWNWGNYKRYVNQMNLYFGKQGIDFVKDQNPVNFL